MATTDASGNIYLDYANDGKTAVIAPHASGSSTFFRAWVSGTTGKWVITAVDPITGSTQNNASKAIRFWVVKFNSM